MQDWQSDIISQFGAQIIDWASDTHRKDHRDRAPIDPILLARPLDTNSVSDLVRYCNTHAIKIIPYAGGTGLVMGHMPERTDRMIMLSVERMNNIRAIHANEKTAIVDAGVILADLHAALDTHDLMFPLSLASEGSARLGGLLASNAGGVNVLRYGNARALCLGLEAVMPDGSIYHGLKRLRKDNAGYDLAQLLIGSEGTLGIITGASLSLFATPQSYATALFVVDDPHTALQVLNKFQAAHENNLNAFELISGRALDYLKRFIPDARQPFETAPDWLVLVELSGSKAAKLAQAMEETAADLFAANLASDGLLAQSDSQRADFWMLRESIPLANRARGSVSSHDISVPISTIAEFIDTMSVEIAQRGPLEVNCFGHLGDGNLHFNVFPTGDLSRDDLVDLRPAIKKAVHDRVAALGGSVAAEHGVGRFKVGDLETYGDPAHLAAMRAIKSALDPNGIMNPGAVLRD